mmetsp:Transcript_111106/g.279382  ORF Transcript_111106/g.279382 Transcript_111106/m.279382 type:complete len:634 (+) Transcript_111106:59-1960(+)
MFATSCNHLDGEATASALAEALAAVEQSRWQVATTPPPKQLAARGQAGGDTPRDDIVLGQVDAMMGILASDVGVQCERAEAATALEPKDRSGAQSSRPEEKKRETRIKELAQHIRHFEDVMRTSREIQRQWIGELAGRVEDMTIAEAAEFEPSECVDAHTSAALKKLAHISNFYDDEVLQTVQRLKSNLTRMKVDSQMRHATAGRNAISEIRDELAKAKTNKATADVTPATPTTAATTPSVPTPQWLPPPAASLAPALPPPAASAQPGPPTPMQTGGGLQPLQPLAQGGHCTASLMSSAGSLSLQAGSLLTQSASSPRSSLIPPPVSLPVSVAFASPTAATAPPTLPHQMSRAVSPLRGRLACAGASASAATAPWLLADASPCRAASPAAGGAWLPGMSAATVGPPRAVSPSGGGGAAAWHPLGAGRATSPIHSWRGPPRASSPSRPGAISPSQMIRPGAQLQQPPLQQPHLGDRTSVVQAALGSHAGSSPSLLGGCAAPSAAPLRFGGFSGPRPAALSPTAARHASSSPLRCRAAGELPLPQQLQQSATPGSRDSHPLFEFAAGAPMHVTATAGKPPPSAGSRQALWSAAMLAGAAADASVAQEPSGRAHVTDRSGVVWYDGRQAEEEEFHL